MKDKRSLLKWIFFQKWLFFYFILCYNFQETYVGSELFYEKKKYCDYSTR